MRLVESSDPNEVSTDTASWLLTERAVLAAAVCHELEASHGNYADRRPAAALSLLRRWINTQYPDTEETRPGDRLDEMVVPAGAVETMERLERATVVCSDLAMLWTADTQSDFKSDSEYITRSLQNWIDNGR